ncbi:hypothetical protein, partial [Paraburkholderia sediminicola]|uniref:hypothetical protein n=1 Tax=Paraburkholderia sediminicola TaxID=458836 RepID=UPI0038B8B79A
MVHLKPPIGHGLSRQKAGSLADQRKFEPSVLVARVAPLRRKSTGAFTPKTPWLLYAENPVAPLRRKRNGSYMPEIH